MMNFKPYYTNLWILSRFTTIFRTFRGLSRALLLRKNTLKVIELYPTFECQSKCMMCSVGKYKKTSGSILTIHDYEAIARQGAKMGAIAMVLLGGEPLLASNIYEIIGIFKKYHYFVSIVSNAIALNKDVARNLRKSGLSSIYFSLESLNEEENDKLRGFDGHFRDVQRSIEMCKNEGLLVGLCEVIFPGHVDRFVELLRYCRQNDLLASGGELAVVGAAEGNNIVSEEEHLRVLKLLKEYPRLTFDWALSYFLKPRCPAGKEKIGITCYGDVVGCSLNPISFGNIKEETLENIWNRMGSFSQFKNDSSRCLTAGSRYYINNYIVPIAHLNNNPVNYVKHPNITPEKEPELFLNRGEND